MRLATSSSAGLTPLVVGQGLASLPRLSRFTAIMAAPHNLAVLREGVPEFAARGLCALNGRRRLPRGISLMADQVMHIARRTMARATGTGWSLRRLREGARLTISARRMTLTLPSLPPAIGLSSGRRSHACSGPPTPGCCAPCGASGDTQRHRVPRPLARNQLKNDLWALFRRAAAQRRPGPSS